MSNYTCGPGPVTGPSLVSWPEAFGGLVPFALIAMGSPSRRVCDAPSAIGPWMRVSPIICLLDMLSIYLRLFKYSFQHGPVEAIQRLMVQRFGFESEVSDFSQIARHTYTFRVVMFVFSIWSMIRLFTYEGMILTKLWAAVYLASFLTIEGLVFVSRTCLHQPWPQAQLQPDGVDAAPDFMPDASGPQSLPYQSIALSVAFALYW